MPTLPIKTKSRKYAQDDEAAARRARDISKMGEAYREGGAYTDYDSRPASDTLNAAQDYDTLSRIRRKPQVAYPAPTDADIQRTEDFITRRSPYEESEMRGSYGPYVPRTPMNIDKFAQNMMADRRRREKR